MAIIFLTVSWIGFSLGNSFARQLNFEDLTELSLEDLMDIEIASLAMKSQEVIKTPAAVFVISQEDIKNSGKTSVPELLRMVPGFQVARINSHKWAITARGFNGSLATKLLVMLDGRDVYSPLSSGVFWDEQDVMLEDIERIEIIRGPGGSLWGANAVNGVINIISKNSAETRGTLVTSIAGTEEYSWAIRHGDALSDNAHFRVYFKGYDRDGAVDADQNDTADDWENLQGGFRMDVETSPSDHFIFQGDFNRGEAGEILENPLITPPYAVTVETDSKLRGTNVLGRWNHKYSQGSTLQFQIYYDHIERDNGRLSYSWDTVDVDLSQNLLLGENNEFTWGLDYRMLRGRFSNNFFFSFEESAIIYYLYSGFLQDEHVFFEDHLSVTVGSKFMLTKDSEFEYQPSVRIFYSLSHNHGFWASVARAVRTPDDIETSATHHPLVFPTASGDPPRALEFRGNKDLLSEEVIAYEAGYRYHIRDDFLFDLSLFYNEYDNLRTFESGQPETSDGYTAIPVNIMNMMEGQSYGAEIAVNWRVTQWWKLEGAYSYLKMQLNVDDASTDTRSESAVDEVPAHTVSLRSHFELRDDLDLDVWGRYVHEVAAHDLDHSFALDMQIVWRLKNGIEFSLVGQNLLDSQSPEWGIDRDNHFISEVERSVYMKMTVNF
jgi:iron complex outermembrane receptor protein